MSVLSIGKSVKKRRRQSTVVSKCKGVSTIEATEAAASVIFANSYMYIQLSTLHRVDYITHTVWHWPGLVYTWSSEHARSYGSCLYYWRWWSSSLLKQEIGLDRGMTTRVGMVWAVKRGVAKNLCALRARLLVINASASRIKVLATPLVLRSAIMFESKSVSIHRWPTLWWPTLFL